MNEEETDWENYESGPFCRHWGGLGDCEEECVCGHGCGTHGREDDTSCYECNCPEWKDAEESPDTLKTRAEKAFRVI